MDTYQFEELLAQYEKEIFSFCCYLTMDRNLAEDLYQDTVLKAFECSNKIDMSQNVKAFFFSIAAGKWKNYKRKQKRRQEIAPTECLEEYEEICSHDENSEDRVIRKDKKVFIHSVINSMDDKFRIPLILYYMRENGVEIISEILKIPKGTVKSRLFKGREILKQELIKEGYFYE